MAGLKFYLCQTPAGPQYVHLQADAKKLDPNYQTVEIDTSKQALMDRLNHLMRGPIQGISLAEGDEEEGPMPVSAPVPPPPAAKVQDAKLQRAYDQTGFEQFIWDIPDEEVRRLDQLEAIIQERRAEVTNPKAPRPADPFDQPKVKKKGWGKPK